MTPTTLSKFQDAVLKNLYDKYTDIQGNPFDGQAVSFLKKCLHEDGWKHLGGCLGDFEALLEGAGFVVIPGRNRRGQSARVVTL